MYIHGKAKLALELLSIFGINSKDAHRVELTFSPNDAVILTVQMFATRDQLQAVADLLRDNTKAVSVDLVKADREMEAEILQLHRENGELKSRFDQIVPHIVEESQ